MSLPVLVIGGGLSGLAAAIRIARFNQNVLLVEQHSRLGGLNSYFYRNKKLFETGLHAITNYAEPQDRKAPLNRLLRQLKLKRSELSFCQQLQSKILFQGCEELSFSNDFELLTTEIAEKFPKVVDNFYKLLAFLSEFNPFSPAPFRSARAFLAEKLQHPLLIEMLLCPLMYYGSSHEDDMDLAQFAIMFRAIFQEGMFRPCGTIKDLLDLLADHLQHCGGEIHINSKIERIVQGEESAFARFASGKEIECRYILSTIGRTETERLIIPLATEKPQLAPRLAFVENIFQLPQDKLPQKGKNTIIFFNKGADFSYRQPDELVDTNSGVICFPFNFKGIGQRDFGEIRTTHLANYTLWKELATQNTLYHQAKKQCLEKSRKTASQIIGNFSSTNYFTDMFTPLTIERYTGKIEGAIYGNPEKLQNGNLGLKNVFLAGTDQGFLGIVGSMLSGVSIVNQHILPKL